MKDFKTKADLQAAKLKAGQLVRTQGKNTVDDGEGCLYLIQTPAEFVDAPDGDNDFTIVGGNIAVCMEANVNMIDINPGIRIRREGFQDLSNRIPRIIDGRFDSWIQSVSQTSSGYGSDTMWLNENSGSTKTHNQGTLVSGVDVPDIPTAEFYSRTVVTTVAGASNFVRKQFLFEGVRSYAGQSVTMQFRGRADAQKNIALELVQNFGTGGSPSATVTGIGPTKVQLETSFNRQFVTFTVPDLQGKTVGSDGNDYLGLIFWFDAGTDFNARTDSLGQQSGTFDLACVQDDFGRTPKPFYEFGPREAEDRINRNFERLSVITTGSGVKQFGIGEATAAISASIQIDYSKKRVAPDLTFSAPGTFSINSGGATNNVTTISQNNRSLEKALVTTLASGAAFTSGDVARLEQDGVDDAFIDIDSRLQP